MALPDPGDWHGSRMATSLGSGVDEHGKDRPREGSVGIAHGTWLGIQADIATAVGAAVTSIGVSRALGPEKRGIFFLAFATATLIGVVGNLGMATTGIVYAANREIPLRQLHGLAVGVSLAIGALAALLFLPLEGFWSAHVLKGFDTTMFVLLCAGVPPVVYIQIVLSTLTGLGRIPATTRIRVIVQLGTPPVLVGAAIATQSAQWTQAGWLLTVMANAVAAGVYMAATAARPSRPSWASAREAISFGGRSWVGTLAHQGYLRADVYFLSARSGPGLVGIYSLASVFAERISMIGTAAYSASAKRVGSSKPEDSVQVTAQLIRVLIILMVPTAALLAAAGFPMIPLVFGEQFGSAALPFALLLPGTVCLALWFPLSLFIVSSLRRPGTTTLLMSAAMLVSFPLYYLMIGSWGMTGAAIASSLVYSLLFALGVAAVVRSTDVGPADLLPRRADLTRLVGFVRTSLGRMSA